MTDEAIPRSDGSSYLHSLWQTIAAADASAASTKSQFVSILTSRADVELLNVQHKLVYSSFVENVVFIILPLFLGETNLNLSINIEEREKSCMQNRSIAVI